jgi:hypothetical protein
MSSLEIKHAGGQTQFPTMYLFYAVYARNMQKYNTKALSFLKNYPFLNGTYITSSITEVW